MKSFKADVSSVCPSSKRMKWSLFYVAWKQDLMSASVRTDKFEPDHSPTRKKSSCERKNARPAAQLMRPSRKFNSKTLFRRQVFFVSTLKSRQPRWVRHPSIKASVYFLIFVVTFVALSSRASFQTIDAEMSLEKFWRRASDSYKYVNIAASNFLTPQND